MSDLVPSASNVDQLVREGVAAMHQGRFEDAVPIFETLAMIEDIRADALFNLGAALAGHAQELTQGGRHEDALTLCQRALAIAADDVDALNLQGFISMNLGRFDEAAVSYGHAVVAAPEYCELWSSLGTALFRGNRLDEAERAYRKATTVDPQSAPAMTHLAFTLAILTRHREAVSVFERALQLEPGLPRLKAGLLASRANVADWRDRETLLEDAVANLDEEGAVLGALTSMALYDDPAVHRRCAELTAGAMRPGQNRKRATFSRSEKIRIGYLSSDLHEHATAYLMAEVFERHDRDRFEVVAFHTGPKTNDPMQTRLRAAFDRFHDAASLASEDLAAAIQDAGIEIAIDLNGFVAKGRTAALATRPAPIQVNFLGFPGTLAANFIDYIIGDPIVTPPGCEAYYAEKIVRMPHTYQPNSRRPLPRPASRAANRLPASGIVFCSFNNPYKITPQVFSSWMRILHATPGSVLWLLDLNEGAAENLRREANARGVDPERLVFAPTLDQAGHLSRLALADIALDTAPYTSHTTGSDALWAGVPLVTASGRSFASRVAASLVTAAGLAELDRTAFGDAEAYAIALAASPARLAVMKAALLAAREASYLFDVASFTHDLEAAYATMSARNRAGLPPEGFDIPCNDR